MRKSVVLVLLLVFAFGLGFGSADKSEARPYCDNSLRQTIATNGCCTGKLKYQLLALVCGSEWDGTPCNCVWQCVPSMVCRPANVPDQ
jgi:hypothetical protein